MLTADLDAIRKNRAAFDADHKYRLRIPKDADFARLVTTHRQRIGALTNSLANGAFTPLEYIERLFELFEGGHTDAVLLGRRLAGDQAPNEADDLLFAQLVMDGEAEYLARFLTDIQNGRYTDESGALKVKPIAARARLYTGKYRGTANEVFVLSSDEGETFAWHQLTVEPCDDCPVIEAGGPYTLEQLAGIGHPGQGRQACRTQCGCILRRISDNRFGFSRSYD